MKYLKQKGFTLLEMMVVLGIFGVLSSIVIFNYGKFRSDTLLVNTAYEVALSIREAQIYGVSGRKTVDSGQDFSKAFGIHFSGIVSNQYLLFSDDGDNIYNGTSCVDSGTDTCITPYALQSNIMIDSVKAETGSVGNCSDASSLDFIFKRPNPEPAIVIDSDPNITDITRAQITLAASDGAKRYVIIYNNGQITVSNESICP